MHSESSLSSLREVHKIQGREEGGGETLIAFWYVGFLSIYAVWKRDCVQSREANRRLVFGGHFKYVIALKLWSHQETYICSLTRQTELVGFSSTTDPPPTSVRAVSEMMMVMAIAGRPVGLNAVSSLGLYAIVYVWCFFFSLVRSRKVPARRIK